MKFYSEITKRLYDDEKSLTLAEAKVRAAEQEAERVKLEKLKEEKIKKAERATRAKEVENAWKEVQAAQTKAYKLLKDFTNDYGYFHMSYSNDGDANKNKVSTSDSEKLFTDLLSYFLH